MEWTRLVAIVGLLLINADTVTFLFFLVSRVFAHPPALHNDEASAEVASMAVARCKRTSPPALARTSWLTIALVALSFFAGY